MVGRESVKRIMIQKIRVAVKEFNCIEGKVSLRKNLAILAEILFRFFPLNLFLLILFFMLEGLTMSTRSELERGVEESQHNGSEFSSCLGIVFKMF
jgi:hypothetical protein